MISDIGEYLRRSGRKTIPAILLLLAAKLCGYQGDHHILMASLIEFIHTATLLHDDVVDRAELRRVSHRPIESGRRSVCAGWGFHLHEVLFSLPLNGRPERPRTISRATMLVPKENSRSLSARRLSLEEENTSPSSAGKQLVSLGCHSGRCDPWRSFQGEREKAVEFGMQMESLFSS